MCQGGCERERRIEVIVKIEKKKIEGGGSGQGGCKRRIKVFVLKKFGGGIRVNVNEDLKFLLSQK